MGICNGILAKNICYRNSDIHSDIHKHKIYGNKKRPINTPFKYREHNKIKHVKSYSIIVPSRTCINIFPKDRGEPLHNALLYLQSIRNNDYDCNCDCNCDCNGDKDEDTDCECYMDLKDIVPI